MRRSLGIGFVVVALLALPGVAAAKDFATTARNIVPSGQYGALPVPPDANEQALMYDGLTPLFDQVGAADLNTFFKSEALNLGTDGPGTVEEVPNPRVTVIRDSFGVPHIKADKAKDGIWAAGYLIAKDRSLLMAQARYNARVAVVDVPGITALGLITNLQNFQPSAATERQTAKQSKVLRKAGRKGKKLLKDIDRYVSGINAYLEANSPATEPWTRNDIFALNALKGQFLGEGGGDEARRSQFLGGLQEQYAPKKAMSVFNDLRQFRSKDGPTSIDGKFGYGKIPNKAPGSVIVDPDSYQSQPAIANRKKAERFSIEHANASNTLMINADHSATGNPLMVGGPQIGYFYPGFTYEMNMDAGNLKWRGVTSVPFPGYMLIGRGEDFAMTLTSASADIIDEYAETLCNGSDTSYMYKGKCREMKLFNAGTLGGDPVTFYRTVHGPVVGYATVDGERIAISQKRSSYGKDTLDQLFFQRLSNGKVRNARTFMRAAAQTPQTFNSFYIDDTDNALFTSGRLPKRPKGTDPGLLTNGNGDWEWRGFIKDKHHPQGVNPKDGTMTNWNNTVARGFGAADNQWGRSGSAARVDMLDKNLRRLRDDNGNWDLPAVTSAMNAGATQDVRAVDTVPLMAKLLKGTDAPDPQTEEMFKLLRKWSAQGGSRLDLDLNGEIDDPGAAIMDTAWPLIADAAMGPVVGDQLNELNSLFSRFDLPPGGQYSGWYQYFDRDVRELLGLKVRSPFENAYCGLGKLKRCQVEIWTALATAAPLLEADQGSPDPKTWHSDAVRERISFAPGLLTTTMRYANRPSGIQQVISFDGHRKKGPGKRK